MVFPGLLSSGRAAILQVWTMFICTLVRGENGPPPALPGDIQDFQWLNLHIAKHKLRRILYYYYNSSSPQHFHLVGSLSSDESRKPND